MDRLPYELNLQLLNYASHISLHTLVSLSSTSPIVYAIYKSHSTTLQANALYKVLSLEQLSLLYVRATTPSLTSTEPWTVPKPLPEDEDDDDRLWCFRCYTEVPPLVEIPKELLEFIFRLALGIETFCSAIIPILGFIKPISTIFRPRPHKSVEDLRPEVEWKRVIYHTLTIHRVRLRRDLLLMRASRNICDSTTEEYNTMGNLRYAVENRLMYWISGRGMEYFTAYLAGGTKWTVLVGTKNRRVLAESRMKRGRLRKLWIGILLEEIEERAEEVFREVEGFLGKGKVVGWEVEGMRSRALEEPEAPAAGPLCDGPVVDKEEIPEDIASDEEDATKAEKGF